jgi:beta-glucosidase
MDPLPEIADLPLERRVALTSGADAWHTVAVPEAGVPALQVSDGPNGARGLGVDPAETSVCFPVGSCLAATWDVDLAEGLGAALAAETRAKGAGVVLAPTVNLHRHPLGGRNFESYSEDPHLASRMAVHTIRGLQARGVGACTKHLAGNESEFRRYFASSEIDERTLREVHLAAFEAAVVEAGTWSVMSSYNRLNGTYASDHRWLLTELLRGEWGFDGAVISDWGGMMSIGPAIAAGCDLEMPGPGTRPRKLAPAVTAGEVPEGDVDLAASRVARLARRAAEAEGDLGDGPDPVDVAYEVAVAGMVLLKNDGDALPLAADAASIAVIGPCADPGQIMGGGSSQVNPAHRISPLDGIRVRAGSAEVRHETGCDIRRWSPSIPSRTLSWDGEPGVWYELFASPDLSGEPVVAKRVRKLHARFFGAVEGLDDTTKLSARLRADLTPATSGPHRLGVACAGQARVSVDGSVVVEQDSATDPGDTFYGWGSDEAGAVVELEAGVPVAIEVEFRRADAPAMAGVEVGLAAPPDDEALRRAVEAAGAADVAVVVVGLDGSWETEGYDRRTLALPGRQDELVDAVVAANPRTVVVLNVGSPVTAPWLDRVPAVVQAWYPGQEFGRALAAILFGDESPSGKLPTTFPQRLEDTPAFGNYPGSDDRVTYAEGLHLGHRHYDRHGIEPLFCFGHGLSYTTFTYGDVRVSAPTVPGDGEVLLEVDVTNAGDRAGAEVVQLYVAHPEATVDRPVRQLRGFARLRLAPGETATARFALGFRDLARWDVDAHGWKVDAGPVRVEVGTSSRDVRGEAAFAVSAPAERGP